MLSESEQVPIPTLLTLKLSSSPSQLVHEMPRCPLSDCFELLQTKQVFISHLRDTHGLSDSRIDAALKTVKFPSPPPAKRKRSVSPKPVPFRFIRKSDVLRPSSVEPIPARGTVAPESPKKRGRPAKVQKSRVDCPVKSCFKKFDEKVVFAGHMVEVHGVDRGNQGLIDGLWDGSQSLDICRQGVVDMDLMDLPIAIYTGLKDLANSTGTQTKQQVLQKDLKQMINRVQVFKMADNKIGKGCVETKVWKHNGIFGCYERILSRRVSQV
jgi:hypothetical protein